MNYAAENPDAPAASKAGAAAAAAGGNARVVEASTPNGCLVIRVRASPLPGSVASILDEQGELVRKLLVLDQGGAAAAAGAGAGGGRQQEGVQGAAAAAGGLREKLQAAAREAADRSLALLQVRVRTCVTCLSAMCE